MGRRGGTGATGHRRRGGARPGELVLGYPVDFANTDGTGAAVPLVGASTDGSGDEQGAGVGSGVWRCGRGRCGERGGGGDVGLAGPGRVKITAAVAGGGRTFFGANPNLQEYVVSTRVKAAGAGGAYGVYGAYVDHANYFVVDG